MNRTNHFLEALGLACVLTLCASMAHAGWYEVKNYVGTVGQSPVHVSLQTFGHINRGEPAQWRVAGSYYYDAHRTPIHLSGQRQPDGKMVLCEAARPTACPMTLTFHAGGAAGQWDDDKNTLPIVLQSIGQLDNTNEARLQGVVEVPMWHHTKTHLLLGVYQATAACPVSMRHLRLINKRTGRIDKDIPLVCEAGMIMTEIYSNVSAANNERQVTVGYLGGKMGVFKVITVEKRAVIQK
jgi:hypothetical protein